MDDDDDGGRGDRDDDGDDDERPALVATRSALASFDDDVRYLWSCGDVPVYDEPPSALEFLRNHVAVSRPCVVRNAILRTIHDAGDARPLTLTLDDLVRLFPDDAGGDGPSSSSSLPDLSVDVTPDGHGDCLRRVAVPRRAGDSDDDGDDTQRVFVRPLEATMTLADFRRRLRRGRAAQRQRRAEERRRRSFRENDRTSGLDAVFEGSLESPISNDGPGRAVPEDESLFEDIVLYYSRQNDCLRRELSPLWNLKQSSMGRSGGDGDRGDEVRADEEGDDAFLFPRSFPWAEEAFLGRSGGGDDDDVGGPDAVNLWMGDERAVSSMHKDHYENLFYVLSGEKSFGLCPPSDAPFLYEREVLGGRFAADAVAEEDGTDGDVDDGEGGQRSRRSGRWSVVLDREEDGDDGGACDAADRYAKVHWIAAEPFGTPSEDARQDDVADDDEFPLSRHAHPVAVTVRAGELLYLPSLWFHRVTQTRETVGINYWYDMNFESPLWCYFHLLQQMRPCDDGGIDHDRD